MSGHVYREYRFPKQTFKNQQLGPLINHEMNRCIECYRCVRYYKDYAGGRDLDVFASRNQLYFGRSEDGILESEFAGNLVEICPTGVFTDKTLKRHYTRKWDLQMAPSICTHCAAGCNITAGERYGTLRRVVNRYNSKVNGFFLCDRGRFGYEFVNGPDRIREAQGGTPDEITERVAAVVKAGKRVLGVGSARASLESNFALRELVGADCFYAGVTAAEAELGAAVVRILREGSAPAADLTDLEGADAVLVLGEDVTNTIPRWALALRQASLNVPRRQAETLKIPAWNDGAVRELIQDEKGPFFIVSPTRTRLDDVATSTLRLGAADSARVGFAIAHALDSGAPAVSDLPADLAEWAGRVADALRAAERPVIVSGTGAGSRAVLHAAASIAAALRNSGNLATIALALPAANSAGLALLEGRHLADLEATLEHDRADVLLVLEGDLHARLGDARANALLDRCEAVVVLDSVETATSRRAAAVLPAASFAEGDGTFVSAEGRAQEFYQVMSPQPQIQESWRWLRDIARLAGRDQLAAWQSLDDVRAAVAKAPVLHDVLQAAPPAAFRTTGLRIPRQPHRYSGRTAMLANITVHEPKPPEDPDSPLAFSMEGSLRRGPNAVAPFFWAPAWNSQQSAFKFQQEIGGELRGGDPGVPLFGSHDRAGKASFNGVPPADEKPAGLILTPLYQIFGSEELSRRAPGIAELSPAPYFALHPEDAAASGLSAGDLFTAAGVELPVRLEPSLARGLIGYAAGYAETGGLTPGAKAEAAKA